MTSDKNPVLFSYPVLERTSNQMPGVSDGYTYFTSLDLVIKLVSKETLSYPEAVATNIVAHRHDL